MAARVTVYTAQIPRSREICTAMVEGIRRHEPCEVVDEADYRGDGLTDIAVFYGLTRKLSDVFRDYSRAGRKAVYIDLGYWKRKEPTLFAGYHKFAINSRHPTAYFQKVAHPGDRIAAMNVAAQPWRSNPDGPIVLAGMGDKAAAVEGLRTEQWERRALGKILKHTTRPVIYRPKPSWRAAAPIQGAQYSHPREPLEPLLAQAFAVVTHHSNVAVDGLVVGVPVFCVEGVAAPMGLDDVALIEAPVYPEWRQQWLADVAYCQWSQAEMRSGLPWAHLIGEGLL